MMKGDFNNILFCETFLSVDQEIGVNLGWPRESCFQCGTRGKKRKLGMHQQCNYVVVEGREGFAISGELITRGEGDFQPLLAFS